MSVTPAEYWFARRFPLGAMRSGMAPVHWKGWALFAALFVALLVDAALGVWVANSELGLRGVALCAVLAFGALLGFVHVVHKKGDHVNCVADYREGRAGV
jgi:hypothetical protein